MKPLTIALFFLVSASVAFAETALEATQKIVGTYHGAWTMYGIDSSGNTAEISNWTDVLVASNPVLLADRAVVEVAATLTFANGSIAPRNFREGYLTGENGLAGRRFYELNGAVTEMHRLDSNNWSFTTVPEASELRFLGFDPQRVVSAIHVTVKSTTFDSAGKDTDHISRVTTVQFRGIDETLKTVQFVSLKGFHERQN